MRRLALLACLLVFARSAAAETPVVATFSIVAYNPVTEELGVAVQSRVPAVGAICPYARAGVGAIATQAWAETSFGPRGLDLLAEGASPQEAIDQLIGGDDQPERRQLAIVDASGAVANYTGAECQDWAGGRTGEHYAVQGNILTGEAVVDAMATAFEETEGVLAERLLAALEAGQAAGGDRRGRQAAALLVVREGWGYGGYDDRLRDLRVDDHETPIAELRRIYEIHRKVFPRPEEK